MESSFKVGDVVKIKSGSPLMTINIVTNEGEARCVWFSDQDRDIKWKDLPTSILISVATE